MKSLLIFASAAALLSGCSVLSSVTGGVPSTTSLGSANSVAGANGAANKADDVSKTDSPSASSGDSISSANAGAEANLAKLLAADARYSASTAQGAGSPICQAQGGYTALNIWNVDSRNLDCFVINEQSAKSNPASFRDLREFQDHHMFSKPASAVVAKPGAVWATVQGGKFWAAEFSDTIRLLEGPTCEKGKGLDSDFVIRYLDTYCDFSVVRFDVLTKDLASAKTIKLADEKKTFLEKAIAAAKARGEAASKADAEALQKVSFPASKGNEPAAIQAVKDHIASKKTDIDPASIKKMVMSATWSTTKSPLGIILYRTAEVTVGFARTDAYSIDPNKKCAIASFDVKAEHDGAKFEAPIATGAMSGWTNILCDRLK